MTKEKTLSILYLEDNLDDVALLSRTLNNSELQFKLTCILTKEEFLEADLSRYDLLITDYNLQSYDGLSVIKEVRRIDVAIPIIILSGTVGDEMAAELLKAGADDFVLKENLQRMIPTIHRTIKEASERKEKKRFQKELVEKNLILDTMFNHFEDIVFLKDSNGKYLKVNQAFCNLMKRPPGEIAGKTAHEIYTEATGKIHAEKDEYVKQHQKTISYEFEYKDETLVKTFEVKKTPLINEDRTTGIVGLMIDITAKKILLEESIKIRSILSQAEKLTNSGSFEYHTEMDLIMCSANFKQLMGLLIDGNTISFRKFSQLLKEEDRSIFNEGVAHALDHQTSYYNEHRFCLHPNASSEFNYFKVVIRPDIQNEQKGIFYGTIVDVTTERENQLYLMNKQEDERKELARELHDNLGQKMNAVSMYANKLSGDQPDNDNLQKMKALVHESIDDLGYLINNISVKQIEEHSLEYAINKLISYLPKRFDVSCYFDIDEVRTSAFIKTQMYRVIQEALNNAVKYSEADKVDVSFKQEKGLLSLEISDNGKGFEVENVLNGNGLQNITQRVRRSNGLIKIDSAKNKGTQIKVKVPNN